MSTLHIEQIKAKIEELFTGKVDISDIKDTDSEREAKILTRYLAAYAIYYLSGCSELDAGMSVTDSGNDGGIDAIYYSVQFKKLFIVQSKWRKKGNGEVKKEDILKFHEGINNLFDLEFDNFNKKIQNKSSDIELAITNPETKFEIIIIDTCEKEELTSENTKFLSLFISKMNENGDMDADPIVNFERLNQGKVHKSLLKQRDNIEIRIGLMNWGVFSIENHETKCKAYYGSVSASEIASWWEKFGDRLFDNNIRKALGKTDVNNEIERTLQEHPDMFWFFNNGITIVADSIKKDHVGGKSRDIGSFELKNFTIINGAQTVSSIGNIGKKDDKLLDNAQVIVRIIDINGNKSLIKQITKANNRQNKIDGIDFASQDLEQQRIRDELILEGIDYSIVRSENFKPSEKSFNLQEATSSLAAIHKDVSLAVQAKNSIGKFFEDLDDGIYKKVFNSNITGYYVYNAVIFMRNVEEIIYNKIKLITRKNDDEYKILTYGRHMLTHLLANKNNIHNNLFNKDFNFDKLVLQKDLDKILSKLKETINEFYPNNYLVNLFKNKTKCQFLRNHILNTTD